MQRKQFAPKAFGKYQPDFARYEREKQAWIAANPNSTPEQYQQAMTRIAQQCRI